MGQAADKVRAKQVGTERLLPIPDKTVGEIDRRGSGAVVGISVRDHSRPKLVRMNASFANNHAVFLIFLGNQFAKLVAVTEVDRHPQL